MGVPSGANGEGPTRKALRDLIQFRDNFDFSIRSSSLSLIYCTAVRFFDTLTKLPTVNIGLCEKRRSTPRQHVRCETRRWHDAVEPPDMTIADALEPSRNTPTRRAQDSDVHSHLYF